MAKKVVVTGAGGYIGSITSQLLLSRGYEVVGIDNFSTGFKEPLDMLQRKFGKEKFRWYQHDTSNIKAVFAREPDIAAVFHFAARTIVDESMQNPSLYYGNNTCAVIDLLEAMHEHAVPYIIFSSTAAVYGESEYNPIDEAHPVHPENPYGASKHAAERIVSWYTQKKIAHVILRYFNVCGASDDGSLGNAQQPSYALVQNVVKGALGIEPFELTCASVDTPDKTPIRDYVNVVDLADAHIRALDYLEKGGSSEIINLGTEHGHSVLEIVEMVERCTGTKIPKKKGRAREGECAKVVASNKKAQELLSWKPTHTLEHSIQSKIRWLTKHPNGWSRAA